MRGRRLPWGAGQAKIDTWLGVETANGRLFDLNVVLPRGLELESVGPSEIVESWQLSPLRDEGRTVTARLTFRAQEGNSFALHLVGRQVIDPRAPWPWPSSNRVSRRWAEGGSPY